MEYLEPDRTMGPLKILNLGLYFFISFMLLLIAGFDLINSLMDPTISYANNVPAEIKNQAGWQLRYFSINIFSLLVSIGLISIGLIYYKKGEQNNAWSFVYYIAFLVALAIATLLIYLITLTPATIQP